MESRTPIKVVANWRPPSIERLETCAEGIELAVADSREDLLRLLANAEVFFAAGFDAEMVKAGKSLRWIQAASGGVETFLVPELVESPIQLTSLKGLFDIPAAEHALAVMLAVSRRLDYDIKQHPRRQYEWKDPVELTGKTVGIVGLGNIGRAIARKARCFDTRVLALVRRAQEKPPYVDELFFPGQLPQLLAAADFVVVAVPNTPETRGMISEAELKAMKKTAYLVDISGRSALYDLDALACALREGWIAGANLQYVPPEDSPLWELDNLIVTFHRAVSEKTVDLAVDRFCENLRRYRKGEPLLGVVDKVRGY